MPSHLLCVVAAQGDFLPKIEERVENLTSWAMSDHSDSPSVCKVALLWHEANDVFPWVGRLFLQKTLLQ